MVVDGTAILKVGPALTYGLREACFALSMMKEELVPEWERACFVQRLDSAMQENPKDWKNHYSENENLLHF